MAEITAYEIIKLLARGRTLSVAAERTVRGPRVVIDAAPMHLSMPAILLPVEAVNLAADVRRIVEELGGEAKCPALTTFGRDLAWTGCAEFVAQAEAARRPAPFEVIQGGLALAEAAPAPAADPADLFQPRAN